MNTKGQSINTFKDGLVSDLNAITTPNTVLTDAKNETKIYTGCIYKATSSTSDKCYIGQTLRKFEHRKREHLYHAFSEKSPYFKSHFYRAIRKYGIEDFNWEIIDVYENNDKDVTYETIFLLEEKYIKEFDSFKNGYNLNYGGKGSKGRTISQETRDKIGNAHRGKKLSDETKKKLSDAKIGVLLSEEWKEKIKENTIKAFDKETEIGLARCLNRSEKHKIKVNVFTEDGKLLNTFDSIEEGSLFYKNDSSCSTKCCKRKLQTSGKFGNMRLVWRYTDDNYTVEDKSKIKPVIVDVFDIDDNFISTFGSAKDVCEFYKIGSGSVSLTLQGRQQYCVVKGLGKIKLKYKMFEYE